MIVAYNDIRIYRIVVKCVSRVQQQETFIQSTCVIYVLQWTLRYQHPLREL